MFLFRKPLCNAPFSSIYIDKDGNVTACCFNRKDVFGNIFHETLDKIWNSRVANLLRTTMNQQKFPDGCFICKEAIEAGNYYNSGIYANRQFKPNGILQNIDFELTYLCNYRCVMCYLNSTSYNLNDRAETIVINNIKPYIKQLTHTRFYGGEPMIIPIYKKIWKLIVAENPSCRILIQTNGSVVTEFVKELTVTGNFAFNVSIDSIKDEHFATIRRNGNLQKVLHNMQTLRKLSKHTLTVTITPMTLNAYELPEMVCFFSKQNIPVSFNFLIYPEKYSLKSLNKEELGRILSYYKKHKCLPMSSVQFFNYLKWRQFKKQLYRHYDRINNYDEERLNMFSQNVYLHLVEKHPWVTRYDKDILLTIIKRLLLTNTPNDLINKIDNLDMEQVKSYIEKKIESEQRY